MNNKSLAGLSKKEITIPAYSTSQIDYNETKPNYFRVQNLGTSIIYCGTSHMPTAKSYDFSCNAESMKMYAEPYNRSSLYLYNPSGNNISVVVLSFSAEFDPLTLALSEINLDLSAQSLEVSSKISNFEAPLPVGTNTIGAVNLNGVDMSKLNAYVAKTYDTILNNILTEIKNKTFDATLNGDVTVDNSELESIMQTLNGTVGTMEMMQGQNHDAIISKLDEMKSSLGGGAEIKTVLAGEETFMGGSSVDIEPTFIDNYLVMIDFLANDGEDAVYITSPGITGSITLYPNEVLNNVKIKADCISISSPNSEGKIRYVVQEELNPDSTVQYSLRDGEEVEE